MADEPDITVHSDSGDELHFPVGTDAQTIGAAMGKLKMQKAARPSEAEQAASAPMPGVKNPMQMAPNNLMETLTSRPLTGMESGLSSPAQNPQNAQAMGIGATVGGLVTSPIATLGTLAGGLALGKGARYGAGKLGASPRTQDIAEGVGTLAGGLAGGFAGGATPGLASKLFRNPEGEIAISPSAILNRVVPQRPEIIAQQQTAAREQMFNELAEAKMARQAAQDKLDTMKAIPLKQSPYATQQKAAQSFAAGEAGPNTPMNESPYLNGQKAVAAQLQGNALAKAKAAGKPTIYTPDSPPPPINKTLVSYDGPQLLKKAKTGDIDAINELIRNPRGIDLEQALPNVKFLIEGGRPTRIYGGPGSTK